MKEYRFRSIIALVILCVLAAATYSRNRVWRDEASLWLNMIQQSPNKSRGYDGLGNVLFLQGDAQVHQLEPARFDAVLSRFGVMFFADPVAAFANIRSASRSGGRLVFACWQPLAENQWLLVPGAALAEHVPPAAGFGSGDGPGMFAFASPERLSPILAAAGWRDVQITSEHASILVGGGGSVDDAVEFLRTATMGRTMLAGADAATADRAIHAVRDALTPYTDADGVHLDAAVWLVQAAALSVDTPGSGALPCRHEDLPGAAA